MRRVISPRTDRCICHDLCGIFILEDKTAMDACAQPTPRTFDDCMRGGAVIKKSIIPRAKSNGFDSRRSMIVAFQKLETFVIRFIVTINKCSKTVGKKLIILKFISKLVLTE